jgi:hypothetical protein
MEKINKYTVEALIESGSFLSLSEAQKSSVLKEMTAKEFDQLRKAMLGNTPFISVDKFNLEPNSEIQKNLLNKIKSKPAKKSVVKQLYTYGSSVAAILILLFLTYTYFFQEPTVSDNNSIAEAKDKIEPKESPRETETNRIKPLENEEAFIAEIENETTDKAEKRTIYNAHTKDKEETNPGEDLEVFKSLAPEDLAIETDDDTDLARFSDESERVFHYYTRMN